MILINSVIEVVGKFEDKHEIKNHLYSFIENEPFRIYNERLADEFGEHLFSMTFIPRNIVVLTQRYPDLQLYINSISLRDDLIEKMYREDLIHDYQISEPIIVEEPSA